MPHTYWSTPSCLVVLITAIVFLRFQERCCEKTAILPQRDSLANLEQKKIRPYHSCAEGPTPLASHSSAYRFRDRGLCPQRPPWLGSDIPISAPPVYLTRSSASGLICNPLCVVTKLCLEPRPVVSGLEASVSLDRLYGTHGLRTFVIRKCRWNVWNLCW